MNRYGFTQITHKIPIKCEFQVNRRTRVPQYLVVVHPELITSGDKFGNDWRQIESISSDHF